MEYTMESIKLYTTEDVIDALRITRRTLYRYIKAGQIKSIKIGREYRFTEENIKEFISHGTDKNYLDKLK